MPVTAVQIGRGIVDNGQACVLLPNQVQLAHSGVDISTLVVVAGIAIAAGVVVLALVARRRRASGTRASHGRRVASAALALLVGGALLLGGQDAPAAQAADASTAAGCDLLDWSLISSVGSSSSTITTELTQVTAVELTNVSNVPILLSFTSRITDDPSGLAPYVDLVGNCADCSPNVLFDGKLSTPEQGPETRLTPGQKITVSFDAKVASDVPDAAQNSAAGYELIAHARQTD